MRFVLSIFMAMLLAAAASRADDAPGAAAIKNILTKHKKWTMYYEITEAKIPGELAHKLNWEFFERDRKLMARLAVEFGGCEFEVPLRADGINMRWCILEGEPSLTFDPADAKYPLKDSVNPRKLWLTPAN
ncbi:MAG: hypothetical protein IT539_04145 [Bradyrhizobiaceae bacterium]|nr:hypothetical protein [Bradyrhizobiaceae bacterium]